MLLLTKNKSIFFGKGLTWLPSWSPSPPSYRDGGMAGSAGKELPTCANGRDGVPRDCHAEVL